MSCIHTRVFLSLAAAISMFGVTGCATLANSPTTQVLVSSEPAGASVHVNDIAVGATPLILTLRRRNTNAIGVVSEGYAPAKVELFQGSSTPLLVGNALLFHPAIAIAGLAVDLALGSHRTLNPSVNVVRLTPIGTSRPAPSLTQPTWPPVPVGSTVRLQEGTNGTTVIGVVTAFASDTLLLRDRNSSVLRVHRTGISSFEIGMGRARASSTVMGGAVGALTGCAAGYVVVRTASSRDRHTNGMLGCMILGIPAGTAAGAVVGMLRGRNSWQRVY